MFNKMIVILIIIFVGSYLLLKYRKNKENIEKYISIILPDKLLFEVIRIKAYLRSIIIPIRYRLSSLAQSGFIQFYYGSLMLIVIYIFIKHLVTNGNIDLQFLFYFLNEFVHLPYLTYDSASTTFLLNPISAVNKFFLVFIPLSITLYIFTYREQNLVSEASINFTDRNKRVTTFLIISIFFIILGLHISQSINQFVEINDKCNSFVQNELGIDEINPNYEVLITDIKKPSNFSLYNSCKQWYTDKSFEEYVIVSQYFIWMIVFVISMIMGLYLVYGLVRFISINSITNYIIKKANKRYNHLLFININQKNLRIRTEIFKELGLYVESIYQILSRTIEKNLLTIFYKNYSKWSGFIDGIQSHPRNLLVNKDTFKLNEMGRDRLDFIEHPYRIQPNEYEQFYNLIIRNHLMLIISLYKSHKISMANDCTETFLRLRPRNNNIELRKIFVQSLYDLIIFLYEDARVGVFPILKQIENFTLARKEAKINDTLAIYILLIKRSIEKKDTNLLTNLPYAASRTLSNVRVKDNDEIVSKMERSIHSGNSEMDYYLLFTLLQAALKGIEHSNYSCTGFIIKYVVTNYDGHLINKAFREMSNLKDGLYLLPLDNREDLRLFKDLNVSFDYNNETYKYCLQKLNVLLYSQQKYADASHLYFNKHKTFRPFVDVSLLNTKYLDYIFHKLENVSSYGLLFLKDKDFLEETLNEIKNLAPGDHQLIEGDGEMVITIQRDHLSKLGIKPNEDIIIEVGRFLDSPFLELRKHSYDCSICGSVEGVEIFKQEYVCKRCLDRIASGIY